MNFEELEKEGLIKRLPIDKRKVRDSFSLAERDLRTAEKVLAEDQDWAFSIAYNPMLQAARALMSSKGYRPSGECGGRGILLSMIRQRVFTGSREDFG